jgi:hypothetical protein
VERLEFIDSIESRKYPIWGTIYHPEYQGMEFVGKKWPVLKNTYTDEIAMRISQVVHDNALKNTN